jgi:hypothetical protein
MDAPTFAGVMLAHGRASESDLDPDVRHTPRDPEEIAISWIVPAYFYLNARGPFTA